MRLSDALARGQNGFDVVRLFAALSVMYGHSFFVDNSHGHREPILRFTGTDYSGSLAVYAFFLISGILVSMSYDRQKSSAKFVLLRVARIFPALIVCVTLVTFVVGPIVSTVGPRDYFLDPQIYKWWWHTASLIFGVGTYLPGVFSTVNLKLNVDAPVWTLPMELKCYLIVLMAGSAHLLKRRAGAVLACALGLAYFFYMLTHPNAYYFGDFIIKQVGYSFFPFLVFLIGMLAYAFRQFVYLDLRVAAALWSAYLITRHTAAGVVLFNAAFLYTVLAVSAFRPILKVKLPGDYSYGVYLWGFVVQQTFATYFPHTDNLLSLLVTIPIAICIAMLSWNFVEKPSLEAVRGWVKRNTKDSQLDCVQST